MTTPAVLSRGQKILAACGIFLLVGGISYVYGSSKQSTVVQGEVTKNQETQEIPQEELLFEPNVPVLNPQVTTSQTTPPAVSTGLILPTSNANNNASQGINIGVTAGDVADLHAELFIQPALAASQMSLVEDRAWDRSIFDDIFPFANLVSMQSYLIQDQTGQRVGRVTQIRSIDASVEDVYSYMLMLAKRDTSGRISIEEKVYGKSKVFFYNHLDKKENLRILVQVNDKEAYAVDVPAYLQGVMDSVLSQL